MLSLTKFDKNFSHWLSGYVRVCPICYDKADVAGYLCISCKQFAQSRRYRQWARFQDGIPILSLYEWAEREHEFFKQFAASLKGGGPTAAFEFYAAELLTLRAELRKPVEKTIRRPWVIVPSPAPGFERRDHAEELAWSIAELARARYWPCLERVGKGGQKMRSMAERWSTPQMKLRSGHVANPEFLYIFIDDIVTTGSTAAYAHKCLGRPPHFEIWTIFNRPRLRGLS